MNKLKNKLRVAVVIAMTLIVGFSANAHDFESGGIYYNITSSSSKTVKVTYRGAYYYTYDNEYSGIVVIPESVIYNNIKYSVTSIGSYAFFGCSGLTSVTIGNSVTSIGSSAFEDCSSLISIEIPNSVTSIGNGAFGCCSGLTSIEIPNSVTSIGDYAFSGCSGLTSIEIPNSVTSIGNGAFEFCSGLTSVVWNAIKCKDLGSSPFSANVTLFTFGDSVQYIPAKLCREMSKLTSIEIPNSVTSIGDCAFYDCDGLTSIEIPNSVTSIGDMTFFNCSGLTNVTIGNSVTSIGYFTFGGCSGLTSIVIPNSVTSIGYGAFGDCDGLTSVTIGNSVTSIGEYAFGYCDGLTSIEIPNSVTSIGDYAFKNCSGLTKITCLATTPPTIRLTTFYNVDKSIPLYIPSGCKSAYQSAEYWNEFTNIIEPGNVGYKFEYNGIAYRVIVEDSEVEVTTSESNNYIGNIIIPEIALLGEIKYSVTSIGSYAFCDCHGLTSIEIPNSVSTIGDSAFEGCSDLTSIEIPNSVTSIGKQAFNGCNIKKVIWLTNTPPQGYKKLNGEINYVSNDLYTELNNVYVYPYLSSIFKEGGVKYVPVNPSERTCDVIDCDYDSDIDNIIIDNIISHKGIEMTVKEIMPYALYKQEKIKSVKINNNGNICHYAFKDCTSLATAEISNSGSIGKYCFMNSGLTNVTIGNSVTSIGNSAFENCTSLATADISNSGSIGENCFKDSGLTNVTISNTVTSIGSSAFYNCNSLLEFIIPKSITSIDNYCFQSCSSLKNIIIDDREKELTLGYNLFSDCPLDSVYIGGKIVYNTSSGKGYSPFYRNTSLRTVVVTDKETEIYNNEFYGCTNLKNVKIGDGVKKIGNWAFSGCSSLDYFAFGTNVETIGDEAFSDCTNVTNIISYSDNPPICGTQALDDINKWNCTLKVLDNSVTAYQAADQWKEFFFIESLPIDGKVATPAIVLNNNLISITCETEKTSIYYTLDGTNPTIESTLYSGPFSLDKNCIIKAVATRTNYENSDISTLEVNTIIVLANSIALDQTEITLEAMQTAELIATILPEHTTDKSVVWTSSDENVAIVDENGLVTAIAVGEADITATTVDGSNLSATCKVTVIPTLATSITLDKTEISLEATQTAELTATVLPELTTDKSVIWLSSNNAIATVDANGLVTAIAVGEATITAITTDGSNLSATCKVIVEPTLAESIVLDNSEVTLKASETAELRVTILPELTTDKSVIWLSSNNAIATVDANGLVTAISVGEATITATTTDGSNLSATCKVTVVPTLVISIEVTPTEVEAEEGSEVQLSVVVLPEEATNKEVAWSSSNESVATVDNNGLVSIHKEGEATITATTTDGSNLSATCVIKAFSGIVEVESLNFYVKVVGDDIVVCDAELGSQVAVYGIDGLLVGAKEVVDMQTIIAAPIKGIYLVRVGETMVKVLVK